MDLDLYSRTTAFPSVYYGMQLPFPISFGSNKHSNLDATGTSNTSQSSDNNLLHQQLLQDPTRSQNITSQANQQEYVSYITANFPGFPLSAAQLRSATGSSLIGSATNASTGLDTSSMEAYPLSTHLHHSTS
jgi:hypothetical protein